LDELIRKYGRNSIPLLLDDLASDLGNREIAAKWDLGVLRVAFLRVRFDELYREYRRMELRLVVKAA
jgi:hypothetical protein